jgi:hypothetical protein
MSAVKHDPFTMLAREPDGSPTDPVPRSQPADFSLLMLRVNTLAIGLSYFRKL